PPPPGCSLPDGFLIHPGFFFLFPLFWPKPSLPPAPPVSASVSPQEWHGPYCRTRQILFSSVFLRFRDFCLLLYNLFSIFQAAGSSVFFQKADPVPEQKHIDCPDLPAQILPAADMAFQQPQKLTLTEKSPRRLTGKFFPHHTVILFFLQPQTDRNGKSQLR